MISMICDRCTADETVVDKLEATNHYVWAWGDEGDCCDQHRTSLQGLAAQLSREIAFTSLVPTVVNVDDSSTAVQYEETIRLIKEQYEATIATQAAEIDALTYQLAQTRRTPAENV
jgi:hypothetical protein